MNLFLFISIAFLFIYILGRYLEKIHVPWIFAAMIFGSLLAIKHLFHEITSSTTFVFMADLGMYFLLFIVGFEIELKKIAKQGKNIALTTLSTIGLTVVFGGLVIYYLFRFNWVVSILVALSFATVGEGILVPILDKLKIINKPLGQAIIGVGTLDDIVEIITLVLATLLVGQKLENNVYLIFVSLLGLLVMTIWLDKLKGVALKLGVLSIHNLFFLTIFIFFLFIGVGEYAEAAPLGALLAGVGLKNFLSSERRSYIEREIKSIAYGFFAPIFFLWAGTSIELSNLKRGLLLIGIVIIVSILAKLGGSWLAMKNKIGRRQSLLLGVGLSVRFSTGIVVVKILLDNNIIDINLYSVIIASSVIFTLLAPLVFARLSYKWLKQN
jgi:Kef-type K+ transport system membrane component KefB